MDTLNNVVELVIAGDTCPINRAEEIALNGDSHSLFNDILPVFQSADLVVLNLECPIIDRPTPIVKGGPVLGTNSRMIEILRESGVNGVNLANNHIMDHGSDGLMTTVAICAQNNIFTFGAGNDLDEAKKIRIQNVNGLRIAFLGIAENEYSIATANKPGANPIDLIDLYSQIRSQENEWDYLFVFVHGGNEYYAYPSPMLQKLCRHLVDLGASAVICQHSHTAGSSEVYDNSLIVYGQGNFLFDYPSKYDHWNEGLLLKFIIEKESVSFELIPVQQNDGRVRLMTGDKKREFLSAFSARSVEVLDEYIIQKRWIDFCRVNRDRYMSLVLGHNRYVSFANKRLPLVDMVYSKESLRNMGNVIRCESHREVLLTIGEQLL